MNNSEKLFEAGAAAFREQKFSVVIKHLSAYCHQCEKNGDINSQRYNQAQIGIIKSYQKLGRTEDSINHCKSLTSSENQQLRNWASKMLNQRPIRPTSNTSKSYQKLNVDTKTDTSTSSPPLTTHLLIEESPKVLSKKQIYNSKNNCTSIQKSDSDSSVKFNNKTSSSNNKSTVKSTRKDPNKKRESFDNIDAKRRKSSLEISSSKKTNKYKKYQKNKLNYLIKGKQVLFSGTSLLGAMLIMVGGRFFLKRLAKAGLGLMLGGMLLVFKTCMNDGIDHQISTCLPMYSLSCESPLYPLYQAVANEDMVEVEKLVKRRNILDEVDGEGNTILFWASVAEHCNLEIDTCRMTSQKHQDIVIFLIEQGAEVTAINHRDATPLHWAARVDGTGEIMRMMINRGADINASNIYKNTPLHWAAYHGLATNVEILLNRGADINVKDINGYTVLDYAMGANLSEETIDLLKRRGAVNGRY